MNETPRPAPSTCSPSAKVQPWHLDRHAVVYVRQSTPQQVAVNQESTARQYALAGRAAQLGWPTCGVQVIDDDLGKSGQSIEGRPGFQRLLAEVALDHVGLILGLEMSRLARSCKDWHQLLELCARFRTLLADADGVYDPTDHNDRLLLGLKGTFNEAEIHVLKERMHQGKLNKARRGELVVAVPVGYVKRPTGEVELDSDEQVQGFVRLVFDEFDRQGTVHGVLRYLNEHKMRLPVRAQAGPGRGQLEWRAPCRETLRQMLHHPIYAGAYRYGHRPIDPRRHRPGRRSSGRAPGSLEGCLILLKDRFPAYISWGRFEANQQRLAANRARAEGPGAVREGTALLAGVLWCGRCGRRMYVRYRGSSNRAGYVCSWQRSDYGLPLCQSLAAAPLEDWVTQQLLVAMEPASLAASVTAMAEVEQQREQLARHWRQRLERARHNADRAARQYHACEPENRLVARELERRWDEALRELRRVEEELAHFERAQPRQLTREDLEQIRQLAQQVPALWQSPTTTAADRRQVARLLLERVVVTTDPSSEGVRVRLEWAGGTIREGALERTVRGYQQRSDYKRLTERLRDMHAQDMKPKEIAEGLNREGFRPPKRAARFRSGMVRRLLTGLGLWQAVPRCATATEALAENEWWLHDLAERLHLPLHTLHGWRRRGWVRARQEGGRGGPWAVWADEGERKRLEQLRDCPRLWKNRDELAKLRTPGPQS